MNFTTDLNVGTSIDVQIVEGLVVSSEVDIGMSAYDLVSQLSDEERAELLSTLLLEMGVEDLSAVFSQVEKESTLCLTVGEEPRVSPHED